MKKEQLNVITIINYARREAMRRPEEISLKFCIEYHKDRLTRDRIRYFAVKVRPSIYNVYEFRTGMQVCAYNSRERGRVSVKRVKEHVIEETLKRLGENGFDKAFERIEHMVDDTVKRYDVTNEGEMV